jgi:hypothetical protein
MKSKPIFISHAAVDSVIADVVVDILNTAIGINVTEQVFCTSLEGMKIPPGKDFKEFIREQIQEPKIVVLLVSQNYLASQFCLAELGASWAMSHRIIPFLIPPTSYEDMKAVLVNVNALNIYSSSDWNEALQVFKDELGIDPNVNRWERKRDEQLKRLNPLLKEQPDPPLIPFKKLKIAEERLAGANEEIAELEAEVARKDILLAKLRKMKPAKEVAAVELESLPAAEAFKELVHSVSTAFGSLPGIVIDALYYQQRGEKLPVPKYGHFDSDDNFDEIRSAIEDGYLVDTEPGFEIADDSPPIQEALSALHRMESWMFDNDEFGEVYLKDKGHQFSLSNRKFWNLNFY